jgi:hypothetical protein
MQSLWPPRITTSLALGNLRFLTPRASESNQSFGGAASGMERTGVERRRDGSGVPETGTAGEAAVARGEMYPVRLAARVRRRLD